MSTGDWLALGGIAVGLLGMVAGGFFALSRRLDSHEHRLNELAAMLAQWVKALLDRGDGQ